MKKFLNLALILFAVSIVFVSCSDDDNALPELNVNKGIVIENGEVKIITVSELSFVDSDSDASEIIFTVVTSPEYGKLVNVANENTPITGFTQKDIADGKIKYIHDGSQNLTDSFSFSVSDGQNQLGEYTFNISIGEKQINYFYVLNEGNTNGSISLINRSETVTNNYFESINGLPLGQFPQCMAINDTHAFIVVTTMNGAGYVEIVTKSDFKHTETIGGLSYPREITLVGNKAYVSNGTGADGNFMKENNEVYAVDLNTMSITTEIAVGAGPEKMVVSNGKLYVANSGGWSNDDNTISVINIEQDEVIETIAVKDCPKDMAGDANGDVWVYCLGKPDYSTWPNITYTNSGISKITESTGEVTSFELTNITASGIKNIAVSKDKDIVYYISDAVYAMNITDETLPTTKFIDSVFYGLDVDPVSGNLWCCETAGATTNGTVHVYSPQGEKLKEFTAGNMPNSTTFSY